MAVAESNPAAMLAFDAAVIRAHAPRIGDKPLPPSNPVVPAGPVETSDAALVRPEGIAP